MAVPTTRSPSSTATPPSARSPTVVVPEASQRVQTILLRVYRSLQLCAPICLLTSPSSGFLWQNSPDSLRLGLTLAFGTTVGIITNQDLARRLAIHYRVPLAGDGADHPPNPEAFVSRRSVIASAYVAALLWAFRVGSNTAVAILDVAHGHFRLGRLVGMVLELVIGGLQVILLGSIGMLCAEERREVTERGVVPLLDDGGEKNRTSD